MRPIERAALDHARSMQPTISVARTPAAGSATPRGVAARRRSRASWNGERWTAGGGQAWSARSEPSERDQHVVVVEVPGGETPPGGEAGSRGTRAAASPRPPPVATPAVAAARAISTRRSRRCGPGTARRRASRSTNGSSSTSIMKCRSSRPVDNGVTPMSWPRHARTARIAASSRGPARLTIALDGTGRVAEGQTSDEDR